MKKILFILLTLTFGLTAFAQKQQSEEQLGIQYFQNKEYDKAIAIFEKIYDKNNSSYIYYYYCQALLNLQDYKEAEKLIKRQIKFQPEVQRYKVDLGYIYELSNDQTKAQKEYNLVLKELQPNERAVTELYNAFLTKRLTDYAIETLLKGRRLLGDPKLFSKELSNIYLQLNQTEKAIEEAMSLVADNSGLYLNQAEDILQNLLLNDETGQNYISITSVLKRNLQKYPANNQYFSLLYWVYRINKEYSDALLLAKAMDKREKGDGTIIYHLATEAAQNRDYETTIEALEYVIAKGEKSDIYTSAQFAWLNVKYLKLTSVSPVKLVDAVALEKDFKRILDEYGLHSGTIEWVRKYAHLLAFYVNRSQDAVNILNDAVAATTRNPMERALYKIDLADIELYRGNVWDATLLYSQVEKMYPNDTIGQLAKYKNAKLSFYIGEFNWAKSQLDVLRAATSKLIANDAMYFSLLISDNEEDEEDEEEEEDVLALFSGNHKNLGLQYFARADFYRFQQKDEEAMKMLDSVLIVSPYGSLVDDVYFQKAQILIKQANYIQAGEYLLKILNGYESDILGDDATYLMAQLYEYYLKDLSKAMEYYQALMKNYPGSLYVVDARKKFRELRGDSI